MAEGFPQDRRLCGDSSAELPLEWVLGKEGMASAINLAVLTLWLNSDNVSSLQQHGKALGSGPDWPSQSKLPSEALPEQEGDKN